MLKNKKNKLNPSRGFPNSPRTKPQLTGSVVEAALQYQLSLFDGELAYEQATDEGVGLAPHRVLDVVDSGQNCYES